MRKEQRGIVMSSKSSSSIDKDKIDRLLDHYRYRTSSLIE